MYGIVWDFAGEKIYPFLPRLFLRNYWETLIPGIITNYELYINMKERLILVTDLYKNFSN